MFSTPIGYYGGKQRMVPKLLGMIPPHTQYVEPFCGGAALFWAKQKSAHETINDYDNRVINFWQVLQSNFNELQYKIQHTLHSEQSFTLARDILKEEIKDPVDYAWAFWVQTQMSYSFKLFGGFAFGYESRSSKLTRRKREEFNTPFYNRIKDVEIFNRDAIELILLKDTGPDTFMYLDPPYAESDCGHYEKSKNVYYDLLDILPTLKSKWMLSSYPSDELLNLRDKYGFNYEDEQKNLSVSGKHNAGKVKTECITRNYQIRQQSIADIFGPI